jgi:hypothetical protein
MLGTISVLALAQIPIATAGADDNDTCTDFAGVAVAGRHSDDLAFIQCSGTKTCDSEDTCFFTGHAQISGIGLVGAVFEQGGDGCIDVVACTDTGPFQVASGDTRSWSCSAHIATNAAQVLLFCGVE